MYAIIIAISLSVDATIVSIANGTYTKKLKLYRLFELPLFFGFFQAIMPILGYKVGAAIKGFFGGYECLVGGLLLLGVGIKMIYEAFASSEKSKESISMTFSLALILAIATSIDAFSVGTSFAFLKHPIWILALLSGIITLFFSFIGICIGRKIGRVLGEKAEIISGGILIILAFKIFLGNF